jgi:NAD(P) transhydrogenase subunit alpha
MITGILKETGNEKRVALLPGEVSILKSLGIGIMTEFHAGENAFASDNEYVKAGALPSYRYEVISKSELLLSVNPPLQDDVSVFREGQIICSVVNPPVNRDWVENARKAGLTVIALDLIPRTTKAQSMDILSSMATVSGYKAVLDAASFLPRFFPMFMSASGTIKPAKVLILGAGVAGLQAIATARKLGAVVEVFDVRSAVKEEVLSLGGRFIEVEGAREDVKAGGYAIEQGEEYKKKQQELIHNHAINSDVIICTAQIPGKKAPLLVRSETVNMMKPGSVIIDLAASSGGNCESTINGQNHITNGVQIIGKTDYPSAMPADASRMFGSNVLNFLKLIIDKNGNMTLNLEDEILRDTVIVHRFEYISSRIKQILEINS